MASARTGAVAVSGIDYVCQRMQRAGMDAYWQFVAAVFGVFGVAIVVVFVATR